MAANCSSAPHDFYADHPTSSCNLIIGDKTLKVSSELLGMHSHFFRSLFFKANPNNGGENGDNEGTPNLIRTDVNDVRLDNVKVDEVIELLNIIYPSDHPITDHNVKFIIELADKYLFNVVLHECEQFLRSGSKLSKEDRLLLADKYHLCDLVDSIVKELSKQEIQTIVSLKLTDRTTKAMVKHLSSQ
ncbi:hypothetical protein PENTCL1PPCAC_19801 [Pristionchus entomophagus]|uniref:BTB domain-containing protein n=1 Tax=Pristionchus entomophagus TaxID=358040 RepID=A0AAV5TTM7_9BILA|nr:hypothetical protein PENTCL1PPCAC_19801 [Pristionchus entomophagus]